MAIEILVPWNTGRESKDINSIQYSAVVQCVGIHMLPSIGDRYGVTSKVYLFCGLWQHSPIFPLVQPVNASQAASHLDTY